MQYDYTSDNVKQILQSELQNVFVSHQQRNSWSETSTNTESKFGVTLV